MVKFILDERVPLEEAVTHCFSLEQAPEAFTLFDSGQTGKVILEWA
jgi:propanol-preferring alcohol dehydrogenase